MMNFVSERYTETFAALSNLQSTLLCHGCQTSICNQENSQKELISLGICEHRFCRSCVEENKGSVCPVCSMPYRSTSVHVDKQLSNIASLCFSFSSILTGEAEEFPPEENAAQSLNETLSRSHRRSEKPTPLKDQPLNKNGLTTPEKTRRGRKRTVDNTPGSSGKTKFKSFSDKTPRTKQSSSRGSEVGSNATQDIWSDIGIRVEQKNSVDIPGKRGARSHGEGKSISGVDNTGEKKSNDKEGRARHVSAVLPPTPNRGKGRNHLQDNEPSPAPKKNAAQQGTPSSVSKGNQSSLEKRNAKGETRLQVAALKADFQKVQQLLAEGANPNVKDNAGWTPLHEAVNHGNMRIAELLLNHGASVNAPGLENDTPLHDAVSNYSMECVQLLVKRGANVMARNTHGQTALDMAKTEEMREALLVSRGTTVAPEENILMEDDICEGMRLCFVTSSLSKEEMHSAQICSKLLDAKLIENHCPEVTHSIHGVNAEGLCPRTLKYLNAVLCGTWIVTAEWLNECKKENKRVAEEDFEIAGCTTSGKCHAPQKARLNRLKKLPGLFDGCQFYFHGKFSYPTPSKEELTKIAKSGGGAILTREPRLHNLDDYPYTVPYHASSSSSLSDCAVFVIYDDSCSNPPQVKSQRMSYLPASWLLDSIAAFALLEKTDYLKL